MKPIDQMTLATEVLEKHLSTMLSRTEQSYVSISEMKEQPEWKATIDAMIEYGNMLTRWIPVSERVPTEEDAYKGQVFVFVDGQAESWPFNDLGNATHWCRITPPEDK